MGFCKAKGRTLAILSLDQEKAFDRVDHGFIRRVLEKMGFGPGFLQWVRMLYDGATSSVKVNNRLGADVELQRGVRQGDCLSPNLFVLALEPFIQYIVGDSSILGVPIPGGSPAKIVGYADDVTPLTCFPSDLPKIENIMRIYERATGARFSRSKSELLLFNKFPAPAASIYFADAITDENHVFKLLGVPTAWRLQLKDAWTPAITKFTRILNMWSGKGLSMHGKVVVLRHFAIPVLEYLSAALPLPSAMARELQKKAVEFFWSRRRHKVNEAALQLPRLEGGANLPSIPQIADKLKARWVTRLLECYYDDSPWVQLAKWAIGNVNGKWAHHLSSLYTFGSLKDADRCPLQFWGKALKAFWGLSPHYEPTGNHDWCLARTIPLFCNETIQHDGKPLTAPRWETLVGLGISRLADLIFFDRIGSFEEIREYYGNVTRKSYDILVGALPPPLVAHACDVPPIRGGSTWGLKEGKLVAKAYRITQRPANAEPDNTPWARTWTLTKETEESAYVCTPGPTAPVQPETILLLRPAVFKPEVPDIVFPDVKAVVPSHLKLGAEHVKAEGASAKTIGTIQRDRVIATTTAKGESSWAHRLGPERQIVWSAIRKRRVRARVPNKWKDVAWLIETRSHFLGEEAANINFQHTPHNCSRCDQLETHEHLFWECPRAKSCWHWVKERWKNARRKSLRLNLQSVMFCSGDKLFTQLQLATYYAIWKARCAEISGGHAFGPALPHLQQLLKRHLRHLHHLKLSVDPWSKNSAFCSLKGEEIVFTF